MIGDDAMTISTRLHTGCSTTALRRGFTLIEMLVVIVMTALILTIVAPKLSAVTTSTSVRSAAFELANRVALARQVAIRRGASTAFHYDANKVWVTSDQNGTQTLVGDTLYLAKKYNVSVVSSRDTNSIVYSTRGFASLGSSATYAVARSGVTQTVCVTAAGLVLSRGCTL
jgi:prepilin-type N-terminal cleavage/methylation domain-containing protein